MEVKKFKGCPYPIVPHPLGYLRTQWGLNQIKSDLLVLLLTTPTERVMMPTFGTPLKRLFFEPNDSIILAQAKQMIISAIKLWEPRVVITNIEVTSGANKSEVFESSGPPTQAGMTGGDSNLSDLENSNQHILRIKISVVDPENISTVDELVLEVPMT